MILARVASYIFFLLVSVEVYSLESLKRALFELFIYLYCLIYKK